MYSKRKREKIFSIREMSIANLVEMKLFELDVTIHVADRIRLVHGMMVGHLFQLMRYVQEDDTRQSADEEYDVEPTMVEAELELAEDLGYDHSILGRHVHSHEQDCGNKVHSLE